MCVIVIIPSTARSQPTLPDYQRMASHNSDGAGIGWPSRSSTGFSWAKGLDAKDVADIVPHLPRPMLVHFRYATAGGDSPALCHPFPVTADMSSALSGEAPALLVHNGHWSDWTDWFKANKEIVPDKSGLWSDSRFAAWATYQYGPGILHRVHGKTALLRVKDDRRVVTTTGYWEELDGCFYSNMSWRPYVNNHHRFTDNSDSSQWEFSGHTYKRR